MAALTGYYDLHALIAYMPFAVAVGLVLIGKHMDKYEDDLAKGIRTLPIRLGLPNAMKLGASVAILAPIAAALGLYAYTGSPYSLPGHGIDYYSPSRRQGLLETQAQRSSQGLEGMASMVCTMGLHTDGVYRPLDDIILSNNRGRRQRPNY